MTVCVSTKDNTSTRENKGASSHESCHMKRSSFVSCCGFTCARFFLFLCVMWVRVCVCVCVFRCVCVRERFVVVSYYTVIIRFAKVEHFVSKL